MQRVDGMEVSHRIVTVPNLLSFVRLALVPFFLALIILRLDFAALLVLVFSSISDFLDGQIARRFGQITRLGQLLDPAADRLFIFAALIGLTVSQVIPLWLLVAVVARDVLLAVLGIVLANHGFGPLPVHHLGKLATFSLFFALPILMLGEAFSEASVVTTPLGWAFALWGAFLYWWAGVVYLIETVRVISLPQVSPHVESDTLDS